jgi:hypothetical protein
VQFGIQIPLMAEALAPEIGDYATIISTLDLSALFSEAYFPNNSAERIAFLNRALALRPEVGFSNAQQTFLLKIKKRPFHLIGKALALINYLN